MVCECDSYINQHVYMEAMSSSDGPFKGQHTPGQKGEAMGNISTGGLSALRKNKQLWSAPIHTWQLFKMEYYIRLLFAALQEFLRRW